jgi:O-antigen biosynthesis protein
MVIRGLADPLAKRVPRPGDVRPGDEAPQCTPRPSLLAVGPRPQVRGPFLFVGNHKLVVKAVTYGTFAAGDDGELFPPQATVRRDFDRIRGAGANAIRTYTPPPAFVLDEARRAGLRVLVGIFWEARNCNLDEPATRREAERAVREAVRRCAAHRDVVLAYVIANEVPPLVARFHGWRTIRRLIHRLYRVAKQEDPGGLVTYANYPSTEFLELEFLDFQTFNIYLRDPAAMGAYIARALLLAKGKPLLLGEIGDDSIRRGEQEQAALLDWTIPLAFDQGACGVCVFAWTDDWTVGGHPVEDWAFGLVDRNRKPKPALEVVRRRFRERPRDRAADWPRVSVVVCNHNGAETLDETLVSLEQLDYPDYEILLVEDGSTDGSRAIAERHRDRIRIIAQENRGLSVARNVGAEAATGSIVAYIDSDAYADRGWLHHLVFALRSGEYAAVGGPNLTPESDGLTAQLVALCPGNPTYVLRDNVHAEHVAGVNMAFRRDALLSLGGFDPVHRRAGDDVDICWRLQDAGLEIAFSPAAIVWHHRRPSMLRYLKQQSGYGEAENQLERKHPDRFNLAGYIRWSGRVYVAPKRTSALFRPFIYHGRLGGALFQTLYQKEPSYLLDTPIMIHWYLIWALALVLAPLATWLAPIGLAMLGLSLFAAGFAGIATEVPIPLQGAQRLRKIATIASLHFVHPVVRWYGRVAAQLRHRSSGQGSRRRRWAGLAGVVPEVRHLLRRPKQTRSYWGVQAQDREAFLRALQQELQVSHLRAAFGADWDNFDLAVIGPLTCTGRIYTAPEHYGSALCCGFRARTAPTAKVALALCAVGGLAGAHLDLALGGLAAVVAVGLGFVLLQRAVLRDAVWGAIERVAQRHGAKRIEPGER